MVCAATEEPSILHDFAERKYETINQLCRWLCLRMSLHSASDREWSLGSRVLISEAPL